MIIDELVDLARLGNIVLSTAILVLFIVDARQLLTPARPRIEIMLYLALAASAFSAAYISVDALLAPPAAHIVLRPYVLTAGLIWGLAALIFRKTDNT